MNQTALKYFLGSVVSNHKIGAVLKITGVMGGITAGIGVTRKLTQHDAPKTYIKYISAELSAYLANDSVWYTICYELSKYAHVAVETFRRFCAAVSYVMYYMWPMYDTNYDSPVGKYTLLGIISEQLHVCIDCIRVIRTLVEQKFNGDAEIMTNFDSDISHQVQQLCDDTQQGLIKHIG